LRSYVAKELRQGFDREHIATRLRGIGWSESTIVAVLDELAPRRPVGGRSAAVADVDAALEKLRAFIARELARGHTKAQIRAVLLKAGWQAKIVDRELSVSQPSVGSESG
jgi:hypothetical protein